MTTNLTPALRPIGVLEYEVPGSHIHTLVIDISEPISGELIEEYAGELAEAVARCNEERHKGHGKTHSHEDAERAHQAALHQLLTKDFQAEWEELERKIRVYHRWGGRQPPSALLLPREGEPRELDLMVVDREGDPWVYPLRHNPLSEVLPPPVEGVNAVKAPVGWYTKPRWRFSRWLERHIRKERETRR